MIAQVVFDLPLDGPFDYLIPEHLVPKVVVGSRVKVSFGPKIQVGFVIGLLDQSVIAKLKPVVSCDPSPVFNALDLSFAKDFTAYYGCTLGETLTTMLRNKKDSKLSIRREKKSGHSFCRCRPDAYGFQIREIVKKYDGSRLLILVPDIFRGEWLFSQLKGMGHFKIGMRSCVFEADGHYDCVIMVDEEDSSYKQEQMPMYETRQVLMARSKVYGFDIVFIGISPSVELMEAVNRGQVKIIEDLEARMLSAKVVDLTNYKFVPGLISPPVRDALEAALKIGKKAILVLNRRGSYRLTRCVDCAEILKCSHCDSPLIYSRSEGKYMCRHCTYTALGNTVCPKCHKPSWKSVGIGVEQLQTELKKQFPQAKIVSFERAAKDGKALMPDTRNSSQSLPEFDILIATNAVLRFQGSLKVQVVAFIDFDAELNRLDMRSAFNAFSLALHISSMSVGPLFIQTRNIRHYVLENLSRGNIKGYYDEEMKLRKEFGFSPFKHWVKISWRGKLEKLTRQTAQNVYDKLSKLVPEGGLVTPPLADAVGRKRDQFRFNVMVQTDHIPKAVALIKSTIQGIKRPSRVIVTMNVNP